MRIERLDNGIDGNSFYILDQEILRIARPPGANQRVTIPIRTYCELNDVLTFVKGNIDLSIHQVESEIQVGEQAFSFGPYRFQDLPAKVELETLSNAGLSLSDVQHLTYTVSKHSEFSHPLGDFVIWASMSSFHRDMDPLNGLLIIDFDKTFLEDERFLESLELFLAKTAAESFAAKSFKEVVAIARLWLAQSLAN